MKIRTLLLSTVLISNIAAAGTWQLLCPQSSKTGCYSLWETITPTSGNGTILISYNVVPTAKLVKPSLVIDFNNMQLSKHTKAVYLIVDKKVKIKIPVVATDKSGVMASRNDKYFLSKVMSQIAAAKTLSLQYNQNNKTQSVEIDMTDFKGKFDKMLHGKQLFEVMPK